MRVSIYVKETIRFLIRNDIPSENFEMLCVEVQPPKCKPFLIICWYRPPNAPVSIFAKAERVLSYLDKEMYSCC